MAWWVEVSREARSGLAKLRHDEGDSKAIRQHLTELAAQANPGELLTAIGGRPLRYAAVGRFRIVFELRPSKSQPPGKLVVTAIIGFSK